MTHPADDPAGRPPTGTGDDPSAAPAAADPSATPAPPTPPPARPAPSQSIPDQPAPASTVGGTRPQPSPSAFDQGVAAPAPDLDDRERELEPRVVNVWRVGIGIAAAFLLLPPAVLAPIFGGAWGFGVTVAALALAVLWVVAWPRAQYRRWRWQLTDLALELRHGVVVRRHQAVPYFRIQQIDVAQGPIDRLLGLATLQVTTASASGSASLPGVPAAAAPGIRVALLTRAAEAVGEHEGELRDAV